MRGGEVLPQVWREWYSDQLVTHLPWDIGRPYPGGYKYNCMVVMASVEQADGQTTVTSSPVIIDEQCGINFCTVCRWLSCRCTWDSTGCSSPSS